MKTKMTPEQLATKARLEKVWNAPGFAAEHEAWRTEHRAAAEMCGVDFSIRIFPIRKGGASAVPSRRRELAAA